MSARRFLALLGALLIMLAPSAVAATASAAPSGHGVTTVSRASVHKHKKHHKKKHHAAPVRHACTHTSSGSCIRGGEFCPQASYGMTGWDAENRHYVCQGDHTHPHWELP
jgi:hypothetical protein